MSQIAISCTWRTAVCENSEAYYFPDKFTRHFKEKYSNPGVYRWRVVRSSGEPKETVYIGEAENIVRRIQRVLTPSRKPKKGDTNSRLNKIFLDRVAAGKRVVLDIADVDPFEINGIRFGRDTLGDRFQRCAIEKDSIGDCRSRTAVAAIECCSRSRRKSESGCPKTSPAHTKRTRQEGAEIIGLTFGHFFDAMTISKSKTNCRLRA